MATSKVGLTTNAITGTLPVANGGTGSTSTTFTNLASNVTGTLPIANGGTGAVTFAAAGLTNSPYFFARRSNTGQSIANDTYATIIFDTEMLDSAGTYNDSTGLWTPGTIGKYFCFAQVAWSVTNGDDWISATAIIDKNSAGYTDSNMKSAMAYVTRRSSGSSTDSFYVSQIFDLSATDTVRVQFQGGWSGASTHETVGYGKTYFGGYKLV